MSVSAKGSRFGLLLAASLMCCGGCRKNVDGDPHVEEMVKQDRRSSTRGYPEAGRSRDDRASATHALKIRSTQKALIRENERKDIDWRKEISDISAASKLDIADVCADLLSGGDLTEAERRGVALKLYEAFKNEPRFLVELLSRPGGYSASSSVILDSVRTDLALNSDYESLKSLYPYVVDESKRRQWAESAACSIAASAGIEEAASWINGIDDYGAKVDAFLALVRIPSIYGEAGEAKWRQMSGSVIAANDATSKVRFESLIRQAGN